MAVFKPSPLDEIVRRDRRWFRAHPERKHRSPLAVVIATSDLGSLDRLRSPELHGLEIESWPKLGHVDPYVPYEASLGSL
jgi:hypothetical protein